jgi:hypothetical protein
MPFSERAGGSYSWSGAVEEDEEGGEDDVLDSGVYASGQGGQLLVDGIEFVMGELAYTSAGGVLF